MGALSRNVVDLWSVQSISDLRARVIGMAQDLGFACVAEWPEPRAIRDPGGRAKVGVTWSNAKDVYGSKLAAYRAALGEWFCSADPIEVARRRQWEELRQAPFLLSQQPVRFVENVTWLSLRCDFGEPAYRDALAVPLPKGRNPARHLYFLSCDPISQDLAGHGASLGSLYALMASLLEPLSAEPANQNSEEMPPPEIALKPRELEVIRWAAAGKTLAEIALITGLSYRTVRYHLERARKRYGYATTQQTIVRAALDYRMDPLGPQ